MSRYDKLTPGSDCARLIGNHKAMIEAKTKLRLMSLPYIG